MLRITNLVIAAVLSAAVAATAQEEPKVIENVTVYKEAGRFAGSHFPHFSFPLSRYFPAAARGGGLPAVVGRREP